MSDEKRSIYVRMLRLQRLRPRPMVRFVLFEGSVALGLLVALSELAWWGFGAALPFVVAGSVKLVDVGVDARHGRRGSEPGTGVLAMRATVAAVRAQQRAARAARAAAVAVTQTHHAPALTMRERNRRVVRGVAAVPPTVRARPRIASMSVTDGIGFALTPRTGPRVVGAWPMPLDRGPIERAIAAQGRPERRDARGRNQGRFGTDRPAG
jgi:hypothetical protein